MTFMKRFLNAKHGLGFCLMRLVVQACENKIITTIYITAGFYVNLLLYVLH